VKDVAIIKLTYEVNKWLRRSGSLEIEYSSRTIEKVCTDASAATRKYGPEMAEKISMRIDQLRSADTVEQMIRFNVGRCHPLRMNRKNQYAVDLIHPYRLVFEKRGNEIQIVNIIEIVDYH
jgi:proteic killer suppression protein